MELGLGNTLLAGDPRLVDHIVGQVKSQGIFDQFRKECIADVDTKPAYQNLRTRVESSVNSFLSKQTWKPDLNKNHLREILRKQIVEAPYLDAGVERIVDQVVNPKVYSVFMPQIEDVVYKFMGLERPRDRRRNGPCGLKDLLPKDLDPVSPESDKNSLKDVSLDSVDARTEDPQPKDREPSLSSIEQSRKDDTDDNSNDRDNTRNGDDRVEEASIDDTAKLTAFVSLNNSGKSEDKPEEEEEDSPTFEPIDIMNLNESNISNDSHLSGISELTSHRSRSPDFSNDASRDNMDFSNYDSQFSKVSSDSRLSIVTDFGSSNHESTPLSDTIKDDKSDSQYPKENFKAVREFDSNKSNTKDVKSSYETERSKNNTPSDFKFIKRSFSSKETSRDGTESNVQRGDARSRKSDSKQDGKKDNRKKSSNHDGRSISSDRPKKMVKDKSDERIRDKEKKEKTDANNEAKDLKDIYKEKIRELREKKELTEKEKLSKDPKLTRETKEKRDSSRDKRDSKEHKSSSSKSSSSFHRSENKNSKSSNAGESKSPKSDSREKGKRDERRHPKDYNKSKSVSDERSERKKLTRSDEKTDVKDSKEKSVARKDNKNGDKKDSKGETDREKKRREEKKTKAKDDHSSLRKNAEDRRSTDRDGSNGSNGKSSQKSGSSSGSSGVKPSVSNLSKESTNTSNSSSEISDSLDDSQNEKLRLSLDDKNSQNCNDSRDYESQAKKLDLGQNEIRLPIKKRPFSENDRKIEDNTVEIIMKKPKFAKNFQEAKRLMKIRRKMEKDKIKRQRDMMAENNLDITVSEFQGNVDVVVVVEDNLDSVPDDERVQIIEVRDEEYDEPYPEIQSDFTLEERSQIILGAESIFTSEMPVDVGFNAKSTLSEMELSIRQSLNEAISDKRIEETENEVKNKPESKNGDPVDSPVESLSRESKTPSPETENLSSNVEETSTKDSTESIEPGDIEITESPVDENNANNQRVVDESRTKDEEIVRESENEEKHPRIIEAPESPKITGENIEIPEIPINDSPAITEENKVVYENIEIPKTPINDSPESDESVASKTPQVRKLESEMSAIIQEDTTETANVETKEACNNDDLKIVEKDSSVDSDNDYLPCLYFAEDNERLHRFVEFLKKLEEEDVECSSSIVKRIVTSNPSNVEETKPAMAPPMPKRKYSISPLTDILVNNVNNNNDAHKISSTIAHDEVTTNIVKKRKVGRPKKQRSSVSLCGQQNLLNGENFVMPLSPESDVSATSEKTPSNPLKDEKRPRGSNQRYASDDLYKPRPFIGSTSRRSRRTNTS